MELLSDDQDEQAAARPDFFDLRHPVTVADTRFEGTSDGGSWPGLCSKRPSTSSSP